MDAVAAPGGLALQPGYISLSALSPGAKGVVMSVGGGSEVLSPLDRRLLEFGFCSGEQVEIIAETRPGRDPFVVRVGNTTLALRRCEAENIWVDIMSPTFNSRPLYPSAHASERVDTTAPAFNSRPPYPSAHASERVDTTAPAFNSRTPYPSAHASERVDTTAPAFNSRTPYPSSNAPAVVEISRHGKSL